MSEDWVREYVLLALRIDKLFRRFAHSWFVDVYYGPPDRKAAVDAEPETPPADLVRAAIALADALPAQGFEPQRAAYLERQVRAMETVCRTLSGERFSLADEVERCFDIRPEWTPEAQFELARALAEEALPGQGSLSERYAAWRRRYELAPQGAGLLAGMVGRALAEARRRTRTFVDLPEDERMEVETVREKPWTAANWYLGNRRSRLELNTDLPVNVAWLLDLMCHEGYPGHHTEAVVKEQTLYRERGYSEQSVLLTSTPQLVIAEGIATLAFEMIFSAHEAEQWLAEHLYPEAGIEPDAADHAKLRMAADLLLGVPGNAAFMLEEGRPDAEVIDYLMEYTLEPEERIRKRLEFLKVPFMQSYVFSYFYGKRLMQPLLQGSDRLAIFRRFLTEQLYPSLLVEWAESSGS